MSFLECDGKSFYAYAMELFFKTGHVTTSEPKFLNHSPEQFVYFDNSGVVSLSPYQRSLFKMFNNISYLFSVNNCTFLSMSLLMARGNRSQVAYDIHTMLHPIVGTDGTICLFQFNDEVMVSFVGYGARCILSDWYPMDDDQEQLAKKLDIANVSIRSGYDYFSDMIYTVSRQYYLTPQPMVYELFPIDFISNMESGKVDKEELNEFIAQELTAPQRKYGDDYIEYDESSNLQTVDISADLDLMLLEMDDDDSNPFDEEIESSEDDEEALPDDFFDEYEQRDEYEFDEVDPEIFRDPTLMVKWLNKHER